ncbi:hypothetical protein NQ318_018913 [Aromia moschata]|uniref:Uncharacterized protein n=1 Tax=Aromia moschata TaxID=1265417 RepID=A0AAV8ZGU4_9CUCU|nr:hypothetical protein NQ318_018913 [Aromia moschata]
MLPLFHIIASNSPTKNMIGTDAPVKPRRKKVDVPVHKSHDVSPDSRKKTFSANFNSRKHKVKNADHEDSHRSPQVHAEVVFEIPETDRTARGSKKQLARENDRLSNENAELVSKFNELEELSVKKITKLRERIQTLQTSNGELEKESKYVKEQYQSLLLHYDNARKELEESRVCGSCEELKMHLEKWKADNGVLRVKNKELTEDLEMLKTVVYRLNVQLERYQDTLRKNRASLSEVHRNHAHTPIAWGSVNTHTLGPLLDAYEDAVKEKQEIISGYETELSNFTGKLREIIDENEALHEKLTEDEGCSVKLRGELERVRRELGTTREQNDQLIKKCALKQDKAEEILKVYEVKRSQNAKKITISQMKRDYDVMHEEYVKCRTENAALREKNKAVEDLQEDFRSQMQNYIPVSVHTASVNECKRWYEELKQQYEKEKQKLKENVDRETKTVDEFKYKINDLKNVKGGLEAKIAQLEKHIKKSEAKHLDLEHTLSEVQLSRSALRKQLHKVMGFAKEMVGEQETLLKALNQRQLENKAVKRIHTDMATKMDSLKEQLKDVQKSAWQELTTVEMKIQEQTDLIESMRQGHEKEIEKLQGIIKEQEEMNLLLKNSGTTPKPHYLLYQEKYST